MSTFFSRKTWLVLSAPFVALIFLILAALIVREIRREDAPERYHRVCSLMLPELPLENKRRVEPTNEEAVLMLRRNSAELYKLSNQTRVLSSPARRMSDAYAAALKIKNDPDRILRLALAATQAGVGLYTHTNDMTAGGTNKVIVEAQALVEARRTSLELVSRMKSAQLELALNGKSFAGPATDQVVLKTEFTEEAPQLGAQFFIGAKHALNGVQTLSLTNISASTLTDAIVTVRRIKPDNTSTLRHYFVPTWRPGETRKMTYEPNNPFDETDEEVDGVQVELISREMTAPTIDLKKTGETWPYTGK